MTAPGALRFLRAATRSLERRREVLGESQYHARRRAIRERTRVLEREIESGADRNEPADAAKRKDVERDRSTPDVREGE